MDSTTQLSYILMALVCAWLLVGVLTNDNIVNTITGNRKIDEPMSDKYDLDDFSFGEGKRV